MATYEHILAMVFNQPRHHRHQVVMGNLPNHGDRHIHNNQ
ncbi:hypothetical protein [Latilactobacillus phage TMW 1.1381 P1]|nr:hypothetical protein [Latilactobacillus phage TMW 1.1381 P1]